MIGNHILAPLSRLSLLSKGLAIVAVLLLIEISMLFILDRLLLQSEADLLQESRVRAIALSTSLLQSAIDKAVSDLVLYRVLKEPSMEKQFANNLEKIGEHMRILRLLLQQSSGQRLDKLNKLDHDLNDLFRDALSLSSVKSRPEELLYGFDQRAVLIKKSKQVVLDLEEFSRGQEEINIAAQKSARARQMARLGIASGILLNLAIALLLGGLFYQSVSRRLSIIASNYQKLSSRQRLIDPLTGHDEISEVDAAFHSMADELRKYDELKRTYFASVSHDIRSPLNSILSTLKLLTETDRIKLSNEAIERLQLVKRSCQRVVDVVSTSLDLEKLEVGQLELTYSEFSLSNAITKAVENVQGLLDSKGQRIDARVDQSTLVNADEQWITQVVTNLLSNACKFSPEESTITIASELIGDVVRLRVRDQGQGIAAQDQQKVFERFKQLHGGSSNGHSSGLGLAICKSVIEQHAGTIGVTSEEGQGAEFWFTIPISGAISVKRSVTPT